MRSFEALLGETVSSESLPFPWSNEERVLLCIMAKAAGNDDEMIFCTHIKSICQKTGLPKNEVRKILKVLRGQLIIDLVSTVYEEGGYAGRAYTIRGLNMYTAAEFKRSLNVSK